MARPPGDQHGDARHQPCSGWFSLDLRTLSPELAPAAPIPAPLTPPVGGCKVRALSGSGGSDGEK
jgi:hypothetical protein